ncbi:MAG: hypothetical protein IJ515_04480 [Clostridia bacterium]|nr:hypothetical protein [Clostridia bacterium]
MLQKVLCLILSATTLFGVIGITASAADQKRGTNRDTASSLEEMQALVGVSSYAEYIEEHGAPSAVAGLPVISVDLTDMVLGSNAQTPSVNEECQDSMEKEKEAWEQFDKEANADTSLYLPAQGQTTWNFQVPDGAASYYYIRIQYYNCSTAESSISSIERKLLIDGAAPFDEASYITLNKSWEFSYLTENVTATDEEDYTDVRYDHEGDTGYRKIVTVVKDGVKTEKIYTISEDINGNSMLPNAVQTAKWNTYYCQDSTGYHEGYFLFYLLNGSHQITLAAEREPVIVKSIELVPYGYDDAIDAEGVSISNEIALPSYAELQAQYAKNNYKPATGGSIITLQAEFPDIVSDSSVYATNNNSSSATYPSEANAQVYNVIGENSYNALGQWAAYKFTVNKSGTYKIGMRYLQSALQGMYICRAIKLSGGDYGLSDGTPSAPFTEAYNAQFNYDKDWQSNYIGDGNIDAFELYFEAGVEYTLYLECSLGSLKNLIQRVENSLNIINENYLSILQLTGSSPDEYTDYDFFGVMPEVLVSLIEQAGELMKVKEELIALCGTNGSHVATLETVAILVNKMGQNNGYDIAANLSNLKSYLGTLGTWINDSKKGTLIVDSITICPADSDDSVLPKTKAGFFKSLWFEITSFIYSFFIDYEAMGLTAEPDENTVSVQVWLATGRDQSNIWRTMVDAENGFTDMTGYGVNLKLVTGGTLLPSILAGKGPDIYMGLGAGEVINYAIRDAVMSVGSTGDGAEAQAFRNNPDKAVFNKEHYIYYNAENDTYEWTDVYDASKNLSFTSQSFTDVEQGNYVSAATDTLELGGIVYGVPQTMSFAMMFYRMDALAEIGQEVPETWGQLLSLLPTLQSNNMQMGVSYILALDFMLYQKGGSLWKYEDDPLYAGAKIDLDSNIAYESFDFVCRLFTDYSFPVSYDASNRFRTGEMPIIIGDYIGTYNTLTVYATEIDGLWEFCPLPGSETGKYDADGNEIINYNSLASVTATVMLHGCKNLSAAWSFLQWQTSADVQANYGNKMVALIGPSAKYEAANKNAIKNLSWTASEREVIEDQMEHMSSIVNYPGSYIKDRYMKFAFLEAVNDSVNPIDALSQYIDTMNAEITRKRQEFNLAYIDNDGVRYIYDGEKYVEDN